MEQQKGRGVLALGILLSILGVAAILVALGMMSRLNGGGQAAAPIPEAGGGQLGELYQRVETLQAEIGAAMERFKATEARLDVERNANDPLRAKLKELASDMEKAQADIRSLRDEKAQGEKLAADLQGQLKNSAMALAQEKKEVETLSAQLAAKSKEAQEQSAEAQKKLATLASEKATLEKNIADARTQIKTLESKIVTIEAELTTSKAAALELEKKIKEMGEAAIAQPGT